MSRLALDVDSWRPARKRLDRRLQIGAAGVALFALSAMLQPRPLLVWNASASAPVGLYFIWPGGRPSQHDMVVARLASPWRDMAAQRHYLPENVPLVKRVAAVSGDLVCAAGNKVFVNGKLVAERLRRDPRARILPWWDGCHRLRDDELFLLMPGQKSSFDGRYFGVTRARDVLGTAWLLWRR